MHSRTSITTGLILAVALVFGGYQAAEARAVFSGPPNCTEGNRCATSRGGDANCNLCCGTINESFCAFYDEDPVNPPLPQGCICA